MKTSNVLAIIDAIAKTLVLLLFTGYVGWYIYLSVEKADVINLPDWLVSLFTIVYMFFFRRAMKQAKKEE